MDYQRVARGKRQLIGLLFFLVGIAGTLYTWREAATERRYLIERALFMPGFAVIGLGLIALPGYREERVARGEEISHLHGLAVITPRWWFVTVLAIAAGALNCSSIEHGYLPPKGWF